MVNAISWDVTPCDAYKNRRLGGKYRQHHQGRKNQPFNSFHPDDSETFFWNVGSNKSHKVS
jgi:hypothetical protein